LRNKSWRIVLASLMMGVAIWGVARLLEPILQINSWRVLGLIVIMAVGGVSYVISGRLTGAFTLAELRSLMRR